MRNKHIELENGDYIDLELFEMEDTEGSWAIAELDGDPMVTFDSYDVAKHEYSKIIDTTSMNKVLYGDENT